MSTHRLFHLNRKTISIVLACLFFLSLLPMLYVAQYNHSAGDDFGYSYETHLAYASTGSFSQALGGAAKTVAYRYQTWQGTFFSIFLMALQPGAFSESLYVLCPFFFLGILILSTWLLLQEVCIRSLGMGTDTCVILCVLLLFFCIQCAPEPSKAFFWFNGAVHYQLNYCLLLLLVASMIHLARKKAAGNRSVFCCILIPLLSAMISGGNYTTMLICFVLLLSLTAVSIARKQFHWIYALALGLFLVGMLINVLAPGNALRQERSGGGMSPVIAVLKAVKSSMEYFTYWAKTPLISAGAFFVPIVWPFVKKQSFSFRYPLLVSVASFAIFSVGFVPPLYGMQTVDIGRLLNVQYNLFVLLFFLNLIYYTGWMAKRIGDLPLTARLRPFAAGFSLFCAIMFIVGCCPPAARSFTSWMATEAIITGTAKQYDAEITARLAIYNGSDTVITCTPLTATPDIFCVTELSENPNAYPNVGMARFFRKESMALVPHQMP